MSESLLEPPEDEWHQRLNKEVQHLIARCRTSTTASYIERFSAQYTTCHCAQHLSIDHIVRQLFAHIGLSLVEHTCGVQVDDMFAKMDVNHNEEISFEGLSSSTAI